MPLVSEWRVARSANISVTVSSAAALGTAQNRVLDEELLKDQLGRLGNTPYELSTVELCVEGRPFAAASMLNAIRREAVERLTALQAQRPLRTLRQPDAVLAEAFRAVDRDAEGQGADQVQLHLLVRNAKQLDVAIKARPASITLDYLDLYGLKPSLERVREAGIEVRVATPRVLKPGEEKILEFLKRLECPLLLRGAGMVDAVRGAGTNGSLTGDFSLNIANALTAEMFLAMGLDRITPGHDLNADQVTALAQETAASRLEVIAYGHLPVFHTEHCVFCRFLSTGTSYKDCGRPCEKHEVALRDREGRAHPLIADVGCRNTVFGAQAQEASAHLQAWLHASIRHFRLEFAHESPEETAAVIDAFQARFAGRWSSEQLARELRRISSQGTTEGSLFVPANYLTLPVLQ